MNLEHVLSKKRFRAYINEEKDKALDLVEEATGIRFDYLKLEPLDEYYKKNIRDRKKAYEERKKCNTKKNQIIKKAIDSGKISDSQVLEMTINPSKREEYLSDIAIDCFNEEEKLKSRLKEQGLYHYLPRNPIEYFKNQLNDYKNLFFRNKYTIMAYNNKTIYYNDKFNTRLYLFKKGKSLNYPLIHEMGHNISKKINPLFEFEKIMDYLLNEVNQDKFSEKLFVLKCLKEGFSQYFSHEFLSNYYDLKDTTWVIKAESIDKDLDKIISHSTKKLNDKKLKELTAKEYPYLLGHRFFRKIAERRGIHGAIFALKNFENIEPSDIIKPYEYLHKFKCTENHDCIGPEFPFKEYVK